MRIRKLSLLLPLVMALMASANQTRGAEPDRQSEAARPSDGATSPIDPTKEADIRRLLDLVGGAKTGEQVMTAMLDNMRPMMANSMPPGEYREKLIVLFVEKFRSKVDPRTFLEMAVPVYDKYLSREDILALIDFYKTPLGQKTLSVMPKLLVELQTVGTRWGEQLGRESITEVLVEHPELRSAMEEAARQNATSQ